MSTPTQNDPPSPKDLQYYAPRKLRDGVNDPPSIQPSSRPDDQRNPQPIEDWTQPVPPLPSSFRTSLDGLDKIEYERPAGFISVKTLAVIAGAAVIGVAVGIGLLELSQWRNTPVAAKDADLSLATRLQAATTDLQKVSKTGVAPTLVVNDGVAEMNAALPLGIEVKNSIAGTAIVLSGLPSGTVISAGSPDGDGQWRVAIEDLPKTRVTPPQDYVGLVTATVELRAGNGAPIVRSPVRLAWRQPPPAERRDNVVLRPQPAPQAVPQAAPQIAPQVAQQIAPQVTQQIAPQPTQQSAVTASAVSMTNEAPALSARQLDPKEVDALMRRADELMANGDLAPARLLLQRAAETKNARAAYQLATTYDPATMKKFGNISVVPDPALAQLWYQRARDWGSTDASGRLEALASQNRINATGR
jgi:hypothetical protein